MVASQLTPARLALECVPKVEFYCGGPRCPEDFPWPACLRAVLEYVGDSFGCRSLGLCGTEWKTSCSYALLMAVSGAAFRLMWKPGWHGDNVATWPIDEDGPAVLRRTLGAIGYDYELVDKGEGEQHLLTRIAQSLRRGVPVIARGVVGPPETCVIAGYDESGDVLVGWSFFQTLPPFNDGLEFEPEGYFRKRNWFADVHDLVILGQRRERAKMQEVLRDTLEWALAIVRAPLTCGGRHNGLAAYDAWADHLLHDDEIDVECRKSGPGVPFAVHDDAVGAVAEGRYYASVFLADMIHYANRVASHLLAAASCYAREHELMWDVWACVGGNGRDPEKARRFADPTARRRIIPIIKEARTFDAEAAEHLARVLAGLS